MGEKIFIGNFSKGLTQNRLPFVIDNDAFPIMLNSYSWRGRVKRKRGTSLLGRLTPTNGGTPPNTPVMGLRDFIFQNNIYPLLLAFNTTNAYMFNQAISPGFFYSVSYYKGSGAPVVWSGLDYQQFWTTNYQGALWATNGKPGFSFKNLLNNPTNSVTQISATQVSITISSPSGLSPNDLLWFNQVTGTISTGSGTTENQNINGQTGIVFSVTPAAGVDTIVVNFTGANGTTLADFQAGAVGQIGIAQYLNRGIAGQDGIRWFDGDNTAGTGTPVPPYTTGWVNFSPPITQGAFGFDDYLVKQYYLVGATAIIPFKDRLLFFSPWIQATDGAPPTQLIDTALWSWNGTPYYSSPTPAAPSGLLYGYDPTAYLANVTGKGGYLAAGISQPIVTVTLNEDVVLVGFTNRRTRFVYSGNDLDPFQFYSINSEIGSAATFSGVTLDRGDLTIGAYGLAMTTQVSTQRIDLEIPDLVFNINNLNNGYQKVSAARDFFREWVYFTYPSADSPWKYPTQSFFYNYRDNTWGVFFENYTSHGLFRISTGGLNLVWSNVQNTYPTWNSWNNPWNASNVTFGFPTVCAGNQQGFVMLLDQGTDEDASGYVQTVTVLDEYTLQINSPNHCLMNGGPAFQVGDYLLLSNMTGATILNDQIGAVSLIPSGNSFDTDNFKLSFTDKHGYVSGYVPGSGLFARLCQPFFQTKQFPTYWNDGRQVRLGVQKYLLDNTTSGEITVNIYLSQNPDDPWTSNSIIPPSSPNNSLIYSNVLPTHPENNPIQSPVAPGSYQIWHRINTSLIGDTVQLGFTLSDDQMRNKDFATSEIALQGIILEVFPGPQLS